jgi:lipopolysaccharide/colanic/teichoic acid biosynthesis glycosyltransferase
LGEESKVLKVSDCRANIDVYFKVGQSKDRLLSTKPGITCRWQVGEQNSIRFEESMSQEVELYRIGHRSLKLDVLTFFKIFKTAFKGEGQ